MPLTVHCRMCGANIAADDLAIRREVVTCSHCSTIQRIAPKGTQKTTEELAEGKTPSGVQVVREGPGRMIITAPHTRQAFVINKPELRRGALIGLAIGAGITVLAALVSLPLLFIFGMELVGIIGGALFLIFLPATFFAILISIIILAKRQQNLPPLRLKEKNLYATTLGAKPVPASAIRQVYSTTTRVLVRRPDEYIDQYMVFALTNTGEREFLLGPLDSAETALYIEEQIEAELGIFELPVYGDPDLPKREEAAMPVSPQEIRVDGTACESCGAEMTITPAENKRGFSACRHCGSLLLLYEPGRAKPILGIPDASGRDSQFAAAEHTLETVVTMRRSAEPVLRISDGKIHILAAGAAKKSIDAAGIKRLNVKEAGWVRKDSSAGEDAAAKDIAAGLKSLREAMAYSGDVDPLKHLIGARVERTYAISAVLSNGEEVNLLDGIRDIGEAFFLKHFLQQVR